MFKAIILSSLAAFLLPSAASAQSNAARPDVDAILRAARQHFARGEDCLKSGNTECARREFDAAIDFIFDQGLDARSDERLRLGLRELIEKINGYETAPSSLNAKGFWKTQEYEGRPEAEKSDVARADQVNARFGPLTPAEFQRKFGELRDAFQEKYNREITLTGADHGEHTRLYGRGSAYDIRVRDLTREQVKFIIATGSSLGLRIKDFSTWDRVAAHNARSQMLGRPLDTYATGVHLHIDRMWSARKPAMVATPAISKRRAKAETPKDK
ncbi:MAG TPA: hypothetical protein VJZ26_00535 [Blastocatellia bacterium]|nr:hypothetical protein [Blastocatellia bacterium]